MDIILRKLIKFLQSFQKLEQTKVFNADTIKGKGVNFMEHTNVMKSNKYYNWHAGAPSEQNFFKAQSILLKKIEFFQKKIKFNNLKISEVSMLDIKNNIEIH